MANTVKVFDTKKLGKGAYEFALRFDQAYAWGCIRDWMQETNPLWISINMEAWKLMRAHDYGKSYERYFGTPEIGFKARASSVPASR